MANPKSENCRRPAFLSEDPQEKHEPTTAKFLDATEDKKAPSIARPLKPVAVPKPAAPAPPEPEMHAPPAPPPSFSPPPAPPTPVLVQHPLDERVVAAIEELRLRATRLAEQARSDALEIGFMVARRILEQELTTSPQPLFALIRSAIKRAGDSRRIVVKLSAADLVRVKEAQRESNPGVLSLAHVELEEDPELSLGDCIVESDLGVVDGRLSTRLAELAKGIQQNTEGGVG